MKLSKNIGIGVGIGLLGITMVIIILKMKKSKNQVIEDVLTTELGPETEPQPEQSQKETLTRPTTPNRQGTTMTLPSLPPVTEIKPPKRRPITTKPPITTVKPPTLIAGSTSDKTYGDIYGNPSSGGEGGAGNKYMQTYFDGEYGGLFDNTWWDSQHTYSENYRYQAK